MATSDSGQEEQVLPEAANWNSAYAPAKHGIYLIRPMKGDRAGTPAASGQQKPPAPPYGGSIEESTCPAEELRDPSLLIAHTKKWYAPGVSAE